MTPTHKVAMLAVLTVLFTYLPTLRNDNWARRSSVIPLAFGTLALQSSKNCSEPLHCFSEDY